MITDEEIYKRERVRTIDEDLALLDKHEAVGHKTIDAEVPSQSKEGIPFMLRMPVAEFRELLHTRKRDALNSDWIKTGSSVPGSGERNTMTNDEINVAIAEACGWTSVQLINSHWCGFEPNAEAHDGRHSIPNYLGDLNAIHEAEKGLSIKLPPVPYVDSEKTRYIAWLNELCGTKGAYIATAHQRAEAFLRVAGLSCHERQNRPNTAGLNEPVWDSRNSDEPDEAKTMADLKRLNLRELVERSHIIIGGGGSCMCGTYDGKAMTCSEIMNLKRSELLGKPTCSHESGYGSDT